MRCALCLLLSALLAVACDEVNTSAPAAAATVASAVAGDVSESDDVAVGVDAASRMLGAMRYNVERGRFVADYGDATAVLTLQPLLQRGVEDTLARGRVRRGGTVLLDVRTGNVLALASHSAWYPHQYDAALAAFAPAASIVKIPSVAALLRHKIPLSTKVCYGGGKRRLEPKHLDDNPRRDSVCATLSDVLPYSLNAALAKLVDRHLPENALSDELSRFGFNRTLAFPWSVEVSVATAPPERFGLAKAAAGFGDVKLSPLHAAVMTNVVASGGWQRTPRLIESIDDGAPLRDIPPIRILTKKTARLLRDMMKETVRSGTGRRAFAQSATSMRGITVAAKTGSLTDYDAGVDYSWLVAFAPADDPEVVVASAIENDIQLWYTRAPDVARDALEQYFSWRAKDSTRGPDANSLPPR